jgi:hypothetical protein
MGIIKRLLGRESEAQPWPESELDEGPTISLWAQDEQTASQLSSDEYFLAGVLMSDAGAASKDFLDALGEPGAALSSKRAHNRAKGGYDVQLTVVRK